MDNLAVVCKFRPLNFPVYFACYLRKFWEKILFKYLTDEKLYISYSNAVIHHGVQGFSQS